VSAAVRIPDRFTSSRPTRARPQLRVVPSPTVVASKVAKGGALKTALKLGTSLARVGQIVRAATPIGAATLAVQGGVALWQRSQQPNKPAKAGKPRPAVKTQQTIAANTAAAIVERSQPQVFARPQPKPDVCRDNRVRDQVPKERKPRRRCAVFEE